MKIFLIGYRCTGKTTIGKILARLLNYPFLDIDKKIESDAKTSIASIVKKSGWEEFRKLEKQALINTHDKMNLIVSTGGGIVIDEDNQAFIKNHGMSIWLFADQKVIIDRLNNDENTHLSRPSLTDDKLNDDKLNGNNLDISNLKKETSTIMSQREPMYSKITKIKFDTSIKTPEEIAQMIKRRIEHDRE
ncbi:MAG: shikimate kinase [Desulfobacteraceae bacterium]|nr:shikimate kinase [Desulfobacteraceae bacterium]